ncbi:metallophosphoesterase [Roseomonas sp. GCM10028921]
MPNLSISRISISTTEWSPLPANAKGYALAIGDVHGKAALLYALHERARDLALANQEKRPTLIRLGDLIDRGENSIAALDLANVGLGLPWVQESNLVGNHEQMLTLAITHENMEIRHFMVQQWLGNGGTAMLDNLNLGIEYATPEAINSALGEDRTRFLSNLQVAHRMGNVLFVHAGLNPSIDVREFLSRGIDFWPEENEESPFWIRDAFLHYDEPHPAGLFVVHGHTIEPAGPTLRRHRLGIDLGSSQTGRICMAEIDGNRYRCHIASEF